MSFRPRLLSLVENKEIRWLVKLGIKGLFDGEYYFLLVTVSNGRTKLIHGEHFKGALVPLLWGMIRQKTQRGFIKHNQSLKVIAETKIEAT